MIDFSYTILILLIPLVVFVVIGLFGNRFKPIVSGLLGTTALFITWILSIVTAYNYFFVAGKGTDDTFDKILAFSMRWLNMTDKLHIDIGVLLDPISVMMLNCIPLCCKQGQQLKSLVPDITQWQPVSIKS